MIGSLASHSSPGGKEDDPVPGETLELALFVDGMLVDPVSAMQEALTAGQLDFYEESRERWTRCGQ
jgi:hypothetical protein